DVTLCSADGTGRPAGSVGPRLLFYLPRGDSPRESPLFFIRYNQSVFKGFFIQKIKFNIL
ncbi:hypothetical protein LQ318_00005, partial [Aliifodinibius salicampi]